MHPSLFCFPHKIRPNATSVYLQGLKDIGQEEGDPWGEEEDSVLY